MNAVQISGGPIREPQRPSYDPRALLSVILNDLATHAVRSRFGDLGEAVAIAADLLEALGVRPVIPEDDDDGAAPAPRPPSEPPGDETDVTP